MQFKVGQKVKWTSQAAGTELEKIGRIVEVVPEGRQPNFKKFRGWTHQISGGGGRDHESYLVSVESKGHAQAKLYWPRVSALEKVGKV